MLKLNIKLPTATRIQSKHYLRLIFQPHIDMVISKCSFYRKMCEMRGTTNIWRVLMYLGYNNC